MEKKLKYNNKEVIANGSKHNKGKVINFFSRLKNQDCEIFYADRELELIEKDKPTYYYDLLVVKLDGYNAIPLPLIINYLNLNIEDKKISKEEKIQFLSKILTAEDYKKVQYTTKEEYKKEVDEYIQEKRENNLKEEYQGLLQSEDVNVKKVMESLFNVGKFTIKESLDLIVENELVFLVKPNYKKHLGGETLVKTIQGLFKEKKKKIS